MLLRTWVRHEYLTFQFFLREQPITGVTNSRTSPLIHLYISSKFLISQSGGSSVRGIHQKQKAISNCNFDAKCCAFNYMGSGPPWHQRCFDQRKEAAYHEKGFNSDRKKDPVRRSVWLCAHRDFWRIGLQHSSRCRPRYRARRGENSGCGRCGETTHVNSRANHFACVSALSRSLCSVARHTTKTRSIECASMRALAD